MSDKETEKHLPKDTNAALREVASTVNKLSKVYIEETEALKCHDNKKFMKLQAKKLVVAREYQNDMSQMIARKNEIKAANPSIKNKLEKMQKEFSDISNKNLVAIERMQRCTERLGNTIRNAAIKAAQKQNGYSYGANGAISQTSRKKAVSAGISETA